MGLAGGTGQVSLEWLNPPSTQQPPPMRSATRDGVDDRNVVATLQQPLPHRLGAAEKAGAPNTTAWAAVLDNRLSPRPPPAGLCGGDVALQVEHRNVDRADRRKLAAQTINGGEGSRTAAVAG